MSRSSENLLAFNTLYDSSVVSISDYSCHAGYGGPESEELVDFDNLVLMRRGVFCKHIGRQSVTADVNQAVFFTKDTTYRISHPSECGDRGTVFAPQRHVLNEIIRELDPSIDDHPTQPFPIQTTTCDSGIFLSHRELVRRLESVTTIEPLWIDVISLQLIANILSMSFAHMEQSQNRKRRRTTISDHVEKVEAVKHYLAVHLGERITLDDIASAVYVSPFHLARIFQKHTGMPIHRYLTRLRLRLSLEYLTEGSADLTKLALELGFSGHSHFTDTFRREFGTTPSDVRSHSTSKSIGQMSKNLEV